MDRAARSAMRSLRKMCVYVSRASQTLYPVLFREMLSSDGFYSSIDSTQSSSSVPSYRYVLPSLLTPFLPHQIVILLYSTVQYSTVQGTILHSSYSSVKPLELRPT
jgi:hypothetical protein